MIVRPRADADIDRCLEMLERVQALDGYPPHLPQELRRFVAAPDALGAWVAEDDGTLVGHVALHPTSSDEVMALAADATGRPPKELAVVARLFVDPGRRRSGAGGALLDVAAAAAREAGLQPILDVGGHFTAAIALYERHGWTLLGEVVVPFRDVELRERVYAGPRYGRPMADDGFTFGGVHHLALVCSDMARTVDFYTNVLGMPLVKTVELPQGMGQHFFFDAGGGDCIAFFWFPDAPPPAPGIAAPAARPDTGELLSAVGSMNHVAFTVPAEKLEEYRERLVGKGVACSEIINHDDSEWGVTRKLHPGVFVRSVYFNDPDGILLEMAAWTRTLTDADVSHEPKSAVGVEVTA